MNERNAMIESVTITNSDHGILTIWLHLSLDGSSQGFGGYALYNPNFKNSQKNYAGHFIWRVMETVGVTEWNDLKGKAVRVRGDYSKIEAIGHIIEDKWFYPESELKAL